jgi:hypothetical protein
MSLTSYRGVWACGLVIEQDGECFLPRSAPRPPVASLALCTAGVHLLTAGGGVIFFTTDGATITGNILGNFTGP